MNSIFEPLADALRDEIEHFGHLLSLFRDQQETLLRPDPETVLEQALNIEQAARVAQRFRHRREQLVESLAIQFNRPRSSTLLRLVSDLPEDMQPMFEALVREINRLIHQTRRLARQNQQLLSRTIEIHRETLRALRPDIFSTTYDQRGGIHGGNGPGGFAAAV